jgi:hypothetical protein
VSGVSERGQEGVASIQKILLKTFRFSNIKTNSIQGTKNDALKCPWAGFCDIGKVI